MIKLPEKPMMARLFDERVGYFTQGLTDYGTGEQQQMQKRFITRYRLEKKDPNAALSEPVQPIVYWVDPATPKKWVPFIKKGIEDWQPAFEMAGFKNGIIAKEAPRAEDPDWSEACITSHAGICRQPTRMPWSPHIHDPRSEVSNRRNMKASSTYTIEQIRDPKFVAENSHTPTLMDYSRFNYVAQPEDKIAAADLIPKIGPYDKWATMWGYKPIPGAKTPEEEKPTLDAWAREQDTKPYLRFSTEGQGGTDPGDNTEAVGDGDATKATALGIKNLARVSEVLMKATSYKSGEPWDELEEVYGRMVGQWTTEMGHVVRVIGGVDSQQKHIGQQGVRFTTVAKNKQAEALQFLIDNAFTTPTFMIRPDILRRIQPTGIITRVQGMQSGIMSQLLQAARLDRMAEQAALDGALAYSPLQFLTDLRAGVWSELAKPGTTINVYRRNLQRSYLDNMDARINGAGLSPEVRSLARGEVKALDRQLAAALPTTTDELTRRHIQDCRDEIATMLDPTVPRPAAGAAGAGRGGRGGIR
jgi:hypothetical protein